ncbi:MAG: FkbM family methyltransferase [Candidatus Woesearchaeota archaeon]|jgi:FkbM family methyltransferase|nr:FkbM family methyltransferase [Candidatus Woesearchaeota archaeon]
MEKLITELYEHKGVKALVRPETSDSFVVREVMQGEYNKLNIREDDIIVDFGLNIGMFTTFALKKGAKKVYSFEPDKENYYLATKNVEMNIPDSTRYKLNNDAVIGNNDKTRDFSINVKRNKGAHSLIKKRGRDTITVSCQNINKVLESIKPTIVKMDIEGGEYECLKSLENNFEGVREFIMEFHHAHLNDIPEHKKYNEILNILRGMFDVVEARAETKKARVNIVYCYNK